MLEPWVSIGVEYAIERLSYRLAEYDEVHLTHHGMAFPLAIGLDFRLGALFAIGPSFQIMHVRPLSACYDGPATRSDVDPNYGTASETCAHSWHLEAQAYTTWTASLGVKVSL